FESAGAAILGTNPGNKYPDDAYRIKKQWFSSSDQLVTMIMGGEVYLPGYEKACQIGRERGPRPLAVRHPPDPGRPRKRPGRRQRHARPRAGQPVHPHDRDVGRRLE